MSITERTTVIRRRRTLAAILAAKYRDDPARLLTVQPQNAANENEAAETRPTIQYWIVNKLGNCLAGPYVHRDDAVIRARREFPQALIVRYNVREARFIDGPKGKPLPAGPPPALPCPEPSLLTQTSFDPISYADTITWAVERILSAGQR